MRIRRHLFAVPALCVLVGVGATAAEEYGVWSSTTVRWSSGMTDPIVSHTEGIVQDGVLVHANAPVASFDAPQESSQALRAQDDSAYQSESNSISVHVSTSNHESAPQEFFDDRHSVLGTDMETWPVPSQQIIQPEDPHTSDTLHREIYLNGLQEVPSVQTNGYGNASFELVGHTLRYSIAVQDLTSAITDAHFHRAPAGVSGPVVQPITFHGNHAQGTWMLSDQELQDLAAGLIYVNVHTQNYPEGEVRGQL